MGLAVSGGNGEPGEGRRGEERLERETRWSGGRGWERRRARRAVKRATRQREGCAGGRATPASQDAKARTGPLDPPRAGTGLSRGDKHISDPPPIQLWAPSPGRASPYSTQATKASAFSITPLLIPTLSMSSVAAVPIPQHAPATPSPSNDPTHVHGLAYPDDLLNALPVLQTRPHPHQPIRALNAGQFSRVHLDYVTTHAPDGVLFPFLHGLEGDNESQNGFFAASPQAHTVPRFRGLVWVACDDDVTMLPSPVSSPDPDTDDDIDDETSSTSSLESLEAMSMDVDVDVSVTPGSPMELDPTLRDSIEADSASPSGKLDDKPLPPPALAAQPHPAAASLLSTGRTRSPSQHPAVLTSSFRPRELLHSRVKEDGSVSCAFVDVRVPDGISLRNFGIQVVSCPFSLRMSLCPARVPSLRHALFESSFALRFSPAVVRLSRPARRVSAYGTRPATDPARVRPGVICALPIHFHLSPDCWRPYLAVTGGAIL